MVQALAADDPPHVRPPARLHAACAGRRRGRSAGGDRPVTGCDREVFNPVLRATLTTDETDSLRASTSASRGADPRLHPPRPSEGRCSSDPSSGALTINPDAADGQTACPDAQAELRLPRGRPNARTTPRSGPSTIGTPALDGPLTGSLYIGEPMPGEQYRLFLIADGFGVHAKLIGSVHPDPADRPADGVLHGPAAGARSRNSTSISSPPTGVWWQRRPTARSTRSTPSSPPWNDLRPARRSAADASASPRAPAGSLPGSGPAVQSASRRRHRRTRSRAPSPNFHLKLDRDDGDQFLGDLNFRMPPGFTGDLRGISYCPEASIAAAAQKPGPQRAGRSELPGLLADRHHQRRRRARHPSLPRGRARCTCPGPSRALRSPSSRSRRRSPGPMTTAWSSSGSPSTSIR